MGPPSDGSINLYCPSSSFRPNFLPIQYAAFWRFREWRCGKTHSALKPSALQATRIRYFERVKKCVTCAHDSRRFSGVLTCRKCARSVHCASTAVRIVPIPIGREEETSPGGACIDLDSHQLLVDLLSS